MSAQGKPVEKKPTPEDARLAELRRWFEEALKKNPNTPKLKELHDTAERAAAETREQLATRGKKPGELPAGEEELNQMVGAAFDTAERRAVEQKAGRPFSTAEWKAVRDYERGVRTGGFSTTEQKAIEAYQGVMGMKVGAGKAPPQPEAPVEQPPVGGSPKAPEAKHKGDLGGSGILAGLGIAAGVILATLGVSHMLNRPAAKMPTPRTSITSSSLTTVEATSTTTTIPPTTEAGGGVEKPPRIEPPKEEPPDLKKKSIDIIKSAEKLPFKDALLTLRRYALNSKGSWESKDSFFDAMQELVDTYNQKNADACRKAMQNLGSRWTRISTEELGGARGIPGTDSQTKPLPREPNQMPNAIIIEQIKPYVDALGKSR